MLPLNIQLKPVSISELKELQAISKKTFFETFAAQNTAENMAHFLATSFTDEKLHYELLNPDSLFFFASLHNKPVGYLKVNFGNAQTELKQDNNSAEIERIYVVQELHGQKIGQLLFNKAIEVAVEKNKLYLWLGVWEKNEKAIRFYEKNGLVKFGSHKFIVGDDEQTDIMMKLVLQ